MRRRIWSLVAISHWHRGLYSAPLRDNELIFTELLGIISNLLSTHLAGAGIIFLPSPLWWPNNKPVPRTSFHLTSEHLMVSFQLRSLSYLSCYMSIWTPGLTQTKKQREERMGKCSSEVGQLIFVALPSAENIYCRSLESWKFRCNV